jgi:RNA polymerase sigma-70 factor (ECF subfamily)
LSASESTFSRTDMSEIPDNELIERMRYAPSVSKFAYSFIRVREDVDDITHNVFCSLWDSRDSLSDMESLKAYLFKMTRNAIFKVFRHQHIVSEYETYVKEGDSGFSDGEKIVTTADLLEMIDLMISNMPEAQKTAFRMSRYENKTYSEIAEHLGVSPKTVQYYISQALSDLRKLTEAMLIFTSLDSLNII